MDGKDFVALIDWPLNVEIILQNFGNTGSSGDECRGDFDDPADNDIDAADLAVMIDEIGRTDCL